MNYGNQYCASHSEWLCAEFVSRALNAGGLFSGVSDYGNYKGGTARTLYKILSMSPFLNFQKQLVINIFELEYLTVHALRVQPEISL